MEKYLNQLTNIFEKYGEKLKLNQGEYLFKSTSQDNNLYLLIEGEGQGEINGQTIFKIYAPELSGEKSFLEQQGKPIDFKITSKNSTIYKLTPSDFDKLSSGEKEKFLTNLVLYLSQRVYKLNAILGFVRKINDLTLHLHSCNLEKLKNLLNIQQITILKRLNGDLIFVAGDFIPNQDIYQVVENTTQKIKLGKNYILINTGKYILFGFLADDQNIDKYIYSNAILYSLGSIEYICYHLENEKNKKIEDTLKSQIF